jgi:hypothetical protein
MEERGLKVIIVDNCNTHKSVALRDLIEDQGLLYSLLSYLTCDLKRLHRLRTSLSACLFAGLQSHRAEFQLP